jgi:hypothetical protein
MENIELLFQGFSVLFTAQNIVATILGAVLGLIVGAMPGIGSLAGVALLLPLTYKFNPTTAIIMLGALYYSNMYGGAFSAILLNIPGDSPAVMTSLDGYPMATVKKRPGQALLTSNLASFIGGTIGMIILTFTGPALADVGLKFGPAEMTALLLVAMTSIGWLVGENPTKGLVLTMFGILLASMGMDTLSGSPRYDFGSIYLLGGIPFTPFVIGIVGFAQVIKLMEDRNVQAKVVTERLTIRGSMITPPRFRRCFRRRSAPASWHLRRRPSRRRRHHGGHRGLRHAEVLQERGASRNGAGKASPPAKRPTTAPRRAFRALAGSGHPRLGHRSGAPGRPDDVGPQPRPAPVHQFARFRLGAHRLPVPGQSPHPGHRLGGDPLPHQDPLGAHQAPDPLHHRGVHRRLLQHQQFDVRRADHVLSASGLRDAEDRLRHGPVLLPSCSPPLESNMRKAFIISRGSLWIFIEKPISWS